MSKRYTVAVDFDGVLHSYTSKWIAPHIIPDPPVDGAIEWLANTIQKFDVVVFTTRGKTWRGRLAVRAWLREYAQAGWCHESIGYRGIEEVKVTAKKPAALIYIDDRAWRFDGKFPTPNEIHNAKPWNKR